MERGGILVQIVFWGSPLGGEKRGNEQPPRPSVWARIPWLDVVIVTALTALMSWVLYGVTKVSLMNHLSTGHIVGEIIMLFVVVAGLTSFRFAVNGRPLFAYLLAFAMYLILPSLGLLSAPLGVPSFIALPENVCDLFSITHGMMFLGAVLFALAYGLADRWERRLRAGANGAARST